MSEANTLLGEREKSLKEDVNGTDKHLALMEHFARKDFADREHFEEINFADREHFSWK
ncbi:MAG: hypothetical protein IJV61_02600 [Paludibacteraceae bacterium]|nr:hypothetical protein [Paludibacteraceae bacterium]